MLNNHYRNFLITSAIYATLIGAYPSFAEQVSIEDAFSPHRGATELIVKTINSAKKSIHVAAFSFTSKPIVSALVNAHDHGVDVEIVLDRGQSNSKMCKLVLEHGIPTRINYRYALMHDKFMVIDDSTVELGSFNYTAQAENKNAENVIVLHGDNKITQDYQNQWKRLWSEGEPPPSGEIISPAQ